MSIVRTILDTGVLASQWLRLEIGPRYKGPPKGSRRLALLAWALPPNSNAGVFRPLSFIKHGARIGWSIDAFCSPPPSSQTQHGSLLLSEVPAGARIHQVPPSLREPSYTAFPRVDGGFRDAIAYARYVIAKLEGDPPNAVLASGPPFFVFVAALFVSRHFGVPMILDYRDEWTECPFDFVDKSGNDLWWERRCLREATSIIYATASLLRHAVKTFPREHARGNGHHIANGWDPDDLPTFNRRPLPDPRQRVCIAHVGNLAGHTPPDALLRTLERAVRDDPSMQDRLCLRFIGRRSPAADSALKAFPYPDMIEVIDHVSKRDAYDLMSAAHILLLISVPELDRSLPSKLIDYIAVGRPVLVFGSEGESSELMDRLHRGRLCHIDDPASLTKTIEELLRLDTTAASEQVQAWLNEHLRARLAERLFEIIDESTVAHHSLTSRTA